MAQLIKKMKSRSDGILDESVIYERIRDKKYGLSPKGRKAIIQSFFK